MYLIFLTMQYYRSMNSTGKINSVNQHRNMSRSKSFKKRQGQIGIQNLYEEGALEIIKLRKFLSLKRETVFLALTIYKNFLKSYRNSRNQLEIDRICGYMTCILIAGKVNQVNPPKIKNIIEACENCVSRHQIMKMQKIICKLINFNFGLQSHLSKCFSEILGTENINNILKCMDQSFKCISDPIYLQIDHPTFALAIIEIVFPKHNKTQISKALKRIIFRLKMKIIAKRSDQTKL